ncbi:unnamed protein product [Lactuca saligna]|uniref:Uncharacterized protein n=1 Tax=Lactuca saligna TaxID=75948 RepID=A0AA35VSX9_LACSI|nr:unnamed protein product [Lactuca saligna]
MVARFFFRLHLSAPLFSFPSFAFQLLSRTSHSSYPLLRSSLLYLLADEAPMKLTPPADEASSANKMKLGQCDSPKCRDLVLAQGALIPLLFQLNEHAKLSILRNSTWKLPNFCRGKPQPSFSQIVTGDDMQTQVAFLL